MTGIDGEAYIARKRARIHGLCGDVNIRYGERLESRDGFILWRGKRLCAVTSQNAHDYFSRDGDLMGVRRGKLVDAIKARLEKRDRQHQARWDKVWADGRCQKYRRPEHQDHWLWNHDFFAAPVPELEHIAALVGARV